MCFASQPRPVVQADSQSRAVKAAGDQAIAARKDAFGYGQTLLGGISNTGGANASVSRQILTGTGS